jgi:hypothetical protein
MITVSVSDWTLLISLLSILVGFASNAVQTGSFLGIKTVPKAWLPYLTLFATFFSGFLQSIAGATSITSTAILQAVVAGFAALTGTTVGITVQQHLIAARAVPANDNAVADDKRAA